MSRVLVLMYHRICAHERDTACYFARGTAVTPDIFAQQVAWLAARFDLVTMAQAAAALRDPRHNARPLCVLTFDDGYRDVIECAEPVCRAYNAPMSVYPIAGHRGDTDSGAAWVDAYYDLLHRAEHRAPEQQPHEGLLAELPHIPPIDDDLRWWVRGLVKQRLFELDPQPQAGALERLGDTLGVRIDHELHKRLYMTRPQLAELLRRGHEVGGHGTSHRRMPTLADPDLTRDIHGSIELLESLGVPKPWVFCYPDGHHDTPVQHAIEAAGFELACTVEPGNWTTASSRLSIPRVLARNRPL